MGIFSDKHVKVYGLNFSTIGSGNGLSELYETRRRLRYLSGGDSEIYLRGFAFYRRGLANRYTSKKSFKRGYDKKQVTTSHSGGDSFVDFELLNGSDVFSRFGSWRNVRLTSSMYGWSTEDNPAGIPIPSDAETGNSYHPFISIASAKTMEYFQSIPYYESNNREVALLYMDNMEYAPMPIFNGIPSLFSSVDNNLYAISELTGSNAKFYMHYALFCPSINFSESVYQSTTQESIVNFNFGGYLYVNNRQVCTGVRYYLPDLSEDAEEGAMKWTSWIYQDIDYYLNFNYELPRKKRLLGLSAGGHKITSWKDVYPIDNIGDADDYTLDWNQEDKYHPDPVAKEEASSPSGFFYACPFVSIKDENGVNVKMSSDEPYTLTEDEKNRVKFLDMLGATPDSLSNFIEHDKINLLSVGMSLSPLDALKSRAVAKELFNFFDTLSFSDQNTLGISNQIMTGELGENLKYEYRFSIKKESSVPSDTIRKWRVICKLNRPMWQVRMKEVQNLYEKSTGNPAPSSLNIRQLYTIIKTNGRVAGATDDQKKAYRDLPPTQYLRQNKPHREFVVDCKESEISDFTKEMRSYNVDDMEDDIVTQVIWDITKYKEIKSHISYRNYFGTKGSIDYGTGLKEYFINGRDVSDPYDGIGIVDAKVTPWFPVNETEVDNDAISVYSIDDGYGYTISKATMKWWTINTNTHADEATLEKAKESFKIPLRFDAFDTGGFYYRVELSTYAPTAALYAVDTITVKWYQRKWFRFLVAVIVVIVSVIITVVSLGSGITYTSAVVSFIVAWAIGEALKYVIDFFGDLFGMDLSWLSSAVVIALSILSGNFGNAVVEIGLLVSDQYLRYALDLEVKKAEALKSEIEEFNENYKEMNERLDMGETKPWSKQDMLQRIQNTENYLRSGAMPELSIDMINNIEESGLMKLFDEEHYVPHNFDLNRLMEKHSEAVENAFPTSQSERWTTLNEFGDENK